MINIRKLVESKLFESSDTYDSSDEKWKSINKDGQWTINGNIVRIVDKKNDSVTIKYESSDKTKELSKEQALKSLKR